MLPVEGVTWMSGKVRYDKLVQGEGPCSEKGGARTACGVDVL